MEQIPFGFSITDARKLVIESSNYINEIKRILERIFHEAKDGKSKLEVSHLLSPETIAELKHRGFRVLEEGHTKSQLLKVVYTIRWD